MDLELVFLIDSERQKIVSVGSNAQENVEASHLSNLWFDRLTTGKAKSARVFVETIAILELARSLYDYTSVKKAQQIIVGKGADGIIRGRISSVVRALVDRPKYLMHMRSLGRLDRFPYVLECLYELGERVFDIKNLESSTCSIKVHFLDYRQVASDRRSNFKFFDSKDQTHGQIDLIEFKKKVLHQDEFKLTKSQREDLLHSLIKGSSTVRKKDVRLHLTKKFVDGFPIEKKLDWFAGRESILERIDTFIGESASGLILITGGPGIGKTATVQYLEASHDSVSHFFRNNQDVDSAYTSLLKLLRSKNDIQVRQVGSLAENLSASLNSSMRNTPLLVCIDAINESASAEDLLRNLPSELGQNVYLVLSSREMTESSLINSPHAKYRKLEIALDYEVEDNTSSLIAFLGQHNPDWSKDSCSELAKLLDGNFQFARTLVEVEPKADIQQLLEIALSILSGTGSNPLSKLYGFYWSDLKLKLRAKHDMWDVVTRLLGLLAFAYEDLRQEDLLRFGNLSFGYFDSAYDFAREFLIEREVDGERVIGIYHTTFKEFVAETLRADRKHLHTLFVQPYITDELDLGNSKRYGQRYFYAHLSQSECACQVVDLMTPEAVRDRYFKTQDKRLVLNDLKHASIGLLENDKLIESYTYLNIFNILRGRDNFFDVAMLAFNDALAGRIERAEELLPDVSSRDDTAVILALIARHKHSQGEDYSEALRSLEGLAEKLEEHTVRGLLVGLARFSIKAAMSILFRAKLGDASSFSISSCARYDFSAFGRCLADISRIAVEDNTVKELLRCKSLTGEQHGMILVSAAFYLLERRDYETAFKFLGDLLDYPHTESIIVYEVMQEHIDELVSTDLIEFLSILPENLISTIPEPDLFKMLSQLSLKELKLIDAEKLTSGRLRAYLRYLLSPTDEASGKDSLLDEQHMLELILGKYDKPEVLLSYIPELSYHALIARLYVQAFNVNGIRSIETFLDVIGSVEDLKLKYFLVYEWCSHYPPEKRVLELIRSILAKISEDHSSYHRNFWRMYGDSIAALEKDNRGICIGLVIANGDVELAEYFVINSLMFCSEAVLFDLYRSFLLDVNLYSKHEELIRSYPPKLAAKVITFGAIRLHWARGSFIEDRNRTVLLELVLSIIKCGSMDSSEVEEVLSWVLLMDPINLKDVHVYLRNRKESANDCFCQAYFAYVSAQDAKALSWRKRMEVVFIACESGAMKCDEIGEEQMGAIKELAFRKVEINERYGKHYDWLEVLKMLRGNERWWKRYLSSVEGLLESDPSFLGQGFSGREKLIELYQNDTNLLRQRLQAHDEPQYHGLHKVLSDPEFPLSYVFGSENCYREEAMLLKFNLVARKYRYRSDADDLDELLDFATFREQVLSSQEGFMSCVVRSWGQLLAYYSSRVHGQQKSGILEIDWVGDNPIINRSEAMELLALATRHEGERSIRRFFFELLNQVVVVGLTRDDLTNLVEAFKEENDLGALYRCLIFFSRYERSVFEVIIEEADVKLRSASFASKAVWILCDFSNEFSVENILAESDVTNLASMLFIRTQDNSLKLRIIPFLDKLDDVGIWALRDSLLSAIADVNVREVIQLHAEVEQLVTERNTEGLATAHRVITNFLLKENTDEVVSHISKASSKALSLAVKLSGSSQYKLRVFADALKERIGGPSDFYEGLYLLPICNSMKEQQWIQGELIRFIREEVNFFMKSWYLHQLLSCVFEHRESVSDFWFEALEQVIDQIRDMEDLDGRKNEVFDEREARQSLELTKALCGRGIKTLPKGCGGGFSYESLINSCSRLLNVEGDLTWFLKTIRESVIEERWEWIHDSVARMIISMYKGNSAPFAGKLDKRRFFETKGVGSWVLPNAVVHELLEMKRYCSDQCQIEILFHAIVSLWSSDRSELGSILEELRDQLVSSNEEYANELQVDFWILYVDFKGRDALHELLSFYLNLPRLSNYRGDYVDIVRLAHSVYSNGMSPGNRRKEMISRIPSTIREFTELELTDFSDLPNLR